MMRQAVCAFMFDCLGAAEITSRAFTDNPASLAVSRKVGYRENGVERLQRRDGEVAVHQRLVLVPEDLNRPPHGLELAGVTRLRTFFALD